jgi:ketosteroid isomerase-like protein
MQSSDLRTAATAAITALALVSWSPVAGAAQDAEDASPDATSVREVVHAFHDALAAGDSTGAVALLHPDVRVYESGHAETLSEYRSGHLAADIEFAGGTDREVLGDHVSGGAGWALYLSEYRMEGSFRDREIETRGTETMLLLETGDGWRIRHIHWSSR